MDEISPIKFFKYYQKNINFKIIDIRDTRDFELYHIVDSINIPYSILIEKHHLFLNCNHTYFIICKNEILVIMLVSSYPDLVIMLSM